MIGYIFYILTNLLIFKFCFFYFKRYNFFFCLLSFTLIFVLSLAPAFKT